MKKRLSIIILFIALFSLCIHVSAAGNNTLVLQGNAESGQSGDEVKIIISITSTPGFAYLSIPITWDETRLDKVSFNGIGLTGWTIKNKAIWANADDSFYTGPILELIFRIRDNIPDGEATVNIGCSEAWNAAEQSVDVTTSCEAIMVHTHVLTEHEKVNPTCDRTGNEAYWSCSGCEKLFADERGDTEIAQIPVLNAIGHEYGDWTVTRPSTVETEGQEERVCKNNSSHVERRSIARLLSPEETGNESTNKKTAETAKNLINALPTVESVTASDRKAVETARNAYNALTDAQRALIDPALAQKLTDAEYALKAAEEKAAKEASDKAAAKAAADKINALTSSISISDKAAFEAARKAYESLTADQKALIDPSVLQKLTDSEAALKRAEEATLTPTDGPVSVPTVNPTSIPSSASTTEPTAKPTSALTPTAVPTPAPHVHEWSDWILTKEPTVMAEGVETRTCECGGKETRSVSKLEPTVNLNFSGTLPLKQKQTFKGVIISGLAKDDYVKKVATSNKKLVKTSYKNGALILKAQKKVGTAKITITLASGLKKTFKVKVQKALVKTKKIDVLSKKVRLKKRGKFDLKTQIFPISSTQKVTYKTSNKKIATVKNGVIIAGKKSGTATITIQSGIKKVKVRVAVG